MEKLSPLRDQLARITQDNSELQQEPARPSQDNTILKAGFDGASLFRKLREMQSAQVQNKALRCTFLRTNAHTSVDEKV